MNLPETNTLLLDASGHVLSITLNRPKSRNAMSLEMVNELMATFDAIAQNQDVRAVVIRGAEQHFCAGGDIKDMANARTQLSKKEGQQDPFFELNRQFGRLITQVNCAPQVVITVLEGAVLGGGFGLACVSDIGITHSNAKFGLPETGLGIPPAQIAPFVVARIGLTQARRLALLGLRFGGNEAKQLGIAHYVCDSTEAIDATLKEVLAQVKQCAPIANRITKQILLDMGSTPIEQLLDKAAELFSAAIQGEEGQEGAMAFIQKRKAKWAEN